jgi:hypothetical protein
MMMNVHSRSFVNDYEWLWTLTKFHGCSYVERFTNLCLNAHEHFKLGLGLGVRELLNDVNVREGLTRNYWGKVSNHLKSFFHLCQIVIICHSILKFPFLFFRTLSPWRSKASSVPGYFVTASENALATRLKHEEYARNTHGIQV